MTNEETMDFTTECDSCMVSGTPYVVLYTTGCPRCKVLKQKLDNAGIPYETKSDVDEMLDLGIIFAPALEVNGEILDFGKAVSWLNSL